MSGWGLTCIGRRVDRMEWHGHESAKGVADWMVTTPFADSGAGQASGWEVLWVVALALRGLSA